MSATTTQQSVTERAAAWARDIFADVEDQDLLNRSSFTMASLIGMVQSAVDQDIVARTDAERLAEIRAYLAEYRSTREGWR